MEMDKRNRTGPPRPLEGSNRAPTLAAPPEPSFEPQVGRPLRTLASAAGLITLTLLDLIALDDITTAGAWMPEIGFIIATIPALVVLAHDSLLRRPRHTGRLGRRVTDDPHDAPRLPAVRCPTDAGRDPV